MSGAAALHGARVLVRAHNLRHGYLNSFLAYAQKAAGWTLGMIADRPYPHYCEGLDVRSENFFLTPNVLKPGDFESDEAQLRRLREDVAACERSTGIPVHRIVLADERNSGRAYGAGFYHFPSTSASAAALRDNSLPERLMLRLFAEVVGILGAFRPDLIIIGGHTSVPDSFALCMVADHRGVPIVISRASKILSHRCFWTPDLFMLNAGGAKLCEKKIGGNVRPCAESFDHLSKFRSEPETVAYIRQIWNVQAAKGFASVLKDFVNRSRRRLAWHLRGRTGAKGKPVFSKLWEALRSNWLRASQERLFRTFTEEELARQHYILIALHKEPELAINFQVPFWHSQKNLIAWLSINLPCGYRLLVRDNRKNEGRRPTSFYRDLLRYPGVDLISPFDAQFKYIRNADLIVADNGTTGWEGLLLGKRVVSIAHNFYAPTGLAEKVSDPSELGGVILRRLEELEVADQAEWDRRLACLIEAEMETTVPEDDSCHQQSLEIVSGIVLGQPKGETSATSQFALSPAG
jgi:hypothetical protein